MNLGRVLGCHEIDEVVADYDGAGTRGKVSLTGETALWVETYMNFVGIRYTEVDQSKVTAIGGPCSHSPS